MKRENTINSKVEHFISKIGFLKGNVKARKVYETWGGRFSEHEQDFVQLDIRYPEVFYLYDL